MLYAMSRWGSGPIDSCRKYVASSQIELRPLLSIHSVNMLLCPLLVANRFLSFVVHCLVLRYLGYLRNFLRRQLYRSCSEAFHLW